MCVSAPSIYFLPSVCQILPKGVVSVIGPASSPASGSTVSHICGEKEVSSNSETHTAVFGVCLFFSFCFFSACLWLPSALVSWWAGRIGPRLTPPHPNPSILALSSLLTQLDDSFHFY